MSLYSGPRSGLQSGVRSGLNADSASVSVDALKGIAVPASSAEWSTLVSGTAISSPTNAYGCQDVSGSLVDMYGLANLATSGVTYQQTATGWTRKAVRIAANSADQIGSAAAGADLATTSQMTLTMYQLGANPGAERDLQFWGGNGDYEAVSITAAGVLKVTTGASGVTTASGVAVVDSSTLVLITKWDVTNSSWAVYTKTAKIAPTWDAAPTPADDLLWGLGANPARGCDIVYIARWVGPSAELSDGNVATLFTLLGV